LSVSVMEPSENKSLALILQLNLDSLKVHLMNSNAVCFNAQIQAKSFSLTLSAQIKSWPNKIIQTCSTEINVSYATFSSEKPLLDFLNSFPLIHTLTLTSISISEEAWVIFSKYKMVNLLHANFENSTIPDQFLDEMLLSCPNIKTFSIYNQVTDKFLDLLSKVPKLEQLTNSQNLQMNVHQLENFIKNCPNLKLLKLNLRDIKNEVSLVTNLKFLETLELYQSRCTDFSFLGEITTLKYLHLQFSMVKDNDIKLLLDSNKQLLTLNLDNCNLLTNKCCKYLAQCDSLIELNLLLFSNEGFLTSKGFECLIKSQNPYVSKAGKKYFPSFTKITKYLQ